jgi:hypothetical protein
MLELQSVVVSEQQVQEGDSAFGAAEVEPMNRHHTFPTKWNINP